MVDKLNYLNIGDAGTFKKTGHYHTSPEDVDDLIAHLGTQSKLVIHFHGGLVKESSGMRVAEHLATAYQGAHPLTIVWETGLLETVKDRIWTIHKTKLFKKLVRWVIRAAAKRWLSVDSRGPGTLTKEQIDAELDKEAPFSDFDLDVEGARGGDGVSTEADIDALVADIRAELEEDIDPEDPELQAILASPDGHRLFEGDVVSETEARGLVSLKFIKTVATIVARVLKRVMKGTDHGLYPTVIEEILQEYYLADVGEWVWGGMKLSAREMWHDNTGRSGVEQHAGTYLAARLAALQQQTGLVIDLVGHSAGSIAICEMFRAIRAQNVSLDIRNVIFMAPAVRQDLFIEEIVDRTDQYQAFSMYTMSDKFESEDRLVPFVYTRSLLYFISGVLEGEADMPLAGMHRYLKAGKPYETAAFKKVRTFLASDNRLVLSDSAELNPGAEPPMVTSARHHGDFDEDAPTISSVNFMLQAAFHGN